MSFDHVTRLRRYIGGSSIIPQLMNLKSVVPRKDFYISVDLV